MKRLGGKYFFCFLGSFCIVLGCLFEKKWVLGWEKKGFVDRKNSDLWKRFLVVYRKHQVDFKWIKGHNNHVQNERCDELAVMASMQKQLSVDAFYEKEEEKLL